MTRPKAFLFYRVAATPNGGLGRIRSIIQQALKQNGKRIRSFAIITPSREDWEVTLGLRNPDNPEEKPSKDTPEFQKRTQGVMFDRFKQDLRRMGYGFRPCKGIGQEGGSGVAEDSFFVANITLQDAHTLWKRYYQWAIVYAGPETNGHVVLMERDGDEGHKVSDLGSMKGDDHPMQTHTHPWNHQKLRNQEETYLWDPDNESPVYKTQYKGQDFVFASYPALCRPRR